MPIETSCPHCARAYTLAENLEGKTVRCKGCEKPFTVVAEDEGGSAPPRQRVSKTPAKASSSGKIRRPQPENEFAFDSEEEEEEEEEERPRKRSKKKAGGGIPIWVWLVGGAGVVVLMCCGGGIGTFFYLGGMDLFGTELTKEKIAQVKTGMSEAEVIAILGRPTRTLAEPSLPGGLGRMPGFPSGLNMKVLVWESGGTSVQLIFRNDKVVAKQVVTKK
jgi:hypothetical protein